MLVMNYIKISWNFKILGYNSQQLNEIHCILSEWVRTPLKDKVVGSNPTPPKLYNLKGSWYEMYHGLFFIKYKVVAQSFNERIRQHRMESLFIAVL